LEKSAEKNVGDIDGTDEDLDENLLNTNEYFFSMKILEEYTNESEAIQYTFGDGLLTVLKKYKAQTHIQISSDDINSIDNRYSVWNNAFFAKGDGGSVVTKLNVRYDYNCNANFYGQDTNGGFLNSYTFKSCIWPWNSSTRKRYSYFTVIQDVLKSHTPYKTSSCGSC